MSDTKPMRAIWKCRRCGLTIIDRSEGDSNALIIYEGICRYCQGSWENLRPASIIIHREEIVRAHETRPI